MASERNFIMSLYPMTKLTFSCCMAVAVFFVPNYFYSLVGFAILLAIASYAGVIKALLLMLAKTIMIPVALMFIMQALFYPGDEILWQWRWLSIKLEGIQHAASLSAKLLVIGGSITLFFKLTPLKDFIAALEQAGVSKTLTYIILSTMQIIPQMQKRSKVIMDAQRSRGMETEGNLIIRARAFLPSIGPLILGSIVGTEERAITLEARAFSAPVKKVRLHSVNDSKLDQILRLLCWVLLVTFVVWRITLWII
jgi:energy-coupling factor transporter transmembrane protein EcfT